MFYKNIISLLTGQYATLHVSTLNWWQIAVAAVQLYQGYAAGQAAKAGGSAAKDVAYDNAADLREFAGVNAEYLLGAAGRNALAQRTIGEANASAVERATTRNLMLYGMQAEEETRRHVYGERVSAGRIRSMPGAAGIQTNTGTPLAFLYEQVDEGIRQRKFMINKHQQTMWTMAEEGKDKAGIMRLTASENAAVIMSNASAQAAVSVLDANRQATAIERGGQLAQSTGNAQASAALIGGIANAAGTIGGAYSSGAFSTSSSSGTATLASNWNSPSFGWQSSSWGGGTGTGMQSSFGNAGFGSGFTVGGRTI